MGTRLVVTLCARLANLLCKQLLPIIVLMATASRVDAETIDVKYCGKLDLTPFACTVITRSSFIHRTCYDRAKQFMVVQLKSVNYAYCEMPISVYDQFLNAPSMGLYSNANIKGTGRDGPFDCRTHVAPIRPVLKVDD